MKENITTENPSSSNPAAPPKMISWWKIAIPILIGMSVILWLFHREFSISIWHSIHFDARTIGCITLAWLFMIGRDFGLSWRFRALTNKDLRWGQAIKVNMLCEFTSAVTPSAVGGSSLGMVFLNSEGIELGRATTLMITTLFLDELFFVVSLPIVMLLIPYSELFGFDGGAFNVGLKTTFWIVYSIVILWTTILFTGILLRPKTVRDFLVFIFRFRPIRRWQPKIQQLGDNMQATSVELRHKSISWWIEAFVATALSWTSRYLVVNALFLGFAPTADQLVVLGRQFVIWIVLMISPTPGGSGVSEWLFTEYYGDMIPPGMALIIALFWRIISYYIYLLIGVCIIPGWIKSLKDKMSHKSDNTSTIKTDPQNK